MRRLSRNALNSFSRCAYASLSACVELEVASLPLVGGRYALSISCGRGRASAFHLERVIEFHVWPADVYGSGVPVEQPHGLVVAPHRWLHRAEP